MSTLAVDNVRPSLGGTSTDLMRGLYVAWWDYDQTTPAVDDSENVSSITDTAAGDHTVNYSNNMASAAYATMLAGNGATAAIYRKFSTGTDLAASVRLLSESDAGTNADYDGVTGGCVGDLA